MPVNHYKRCMAEGGTWNHPMAKFLRPAMPRSIDENGFPKNPEPITERGRRRAKNGSARPKAGVQLLVGLARREHGVGKTGKGGSKGGFFNGHTTDGCRVITLKHGRRIYSCTKEG